MLAIRKGGRYFEAENADFHPTFSATRRITCEPKLRAKSAEGDVLKAYSAS